jgi:hypothetical protein
MVNWEGLFIGCCLHFFVSLAAIASQVIWTCKNPSWFQGDEPVVEDDDDEDDDDDDEDDKDDDDAEGMMF